MSDRGDALQSVLACGDEESEVNLPLASEPSGLADRLSEFTLPVLVVTGASTASCRRARPPEQELEILQPFEPPL